MPLDNRGPHTGSAQDVVWTLDCPLTSPKRMRMAHSRSTPVFGNVSSLLTLLYFLARLPEWNKDLLYIPIVCLLGMKAHACFVPIAITEVRTRNCDCFRCNQEYLGMHLIMNCNPDAGKCSFDLNCPTCELRMSYQQDVLWSAAKLDADILHVR